jgi:diguanylate cyclase (GGDEF)-like protein
VECWTIEGCSQTVNGSNDTNGRTDATLPDPGNSVPTPQTALTGRLLGAFGDWLDRLPEWFVSGTCLLLIFSVAWVDFVTGDEANVSIFYVGPIVVATWLVSVRAGLIASAACVALWSTVEVVTHGRIDWFVWGWNMEVLGAFLLLTVSMVNLAKRSIVAERDASRTDSLTGVANGRAFQDRAVLAVSTMRRTRAPITFCYLDLDHFKEVNDTLGHREGDALLSVLATSLSSRLRSTDMVARLGGDEFGVLLPDTGYEAAEGVLADMQEALTDAVATRWPVGVTGGAVTFLQPPPSTDQMLSIADKLMYEVKQRGPGRIEHVVWPSELDRPVEEPRPS